MQTDRASAGAVDSAGNKSLSGANKHFLYILYMLYYQTEIANSHPPFPTLILNSCYLPGRSRRTFNASYFGELTRMMEFR